MRKQKGDVNVSRRGPGAACRKGPRGVAGAEVRHRELSFTSLSPGPVVTGGHRWVSKRGPTHSNARFTNPSVPNGRGHAHSKSIFRSSTLKHVPDMQQKQQKQKRPPPATGPQPPSGGRGDCGSAVKHSQPNGGPKEAHPT